MVYLSKRKRYDKYIGMKVCPSCGDKFPPNYQICSRCLVELPEINEKENRLHKRLSVAFLCLFIAVFLVDFVAGTALVIETGKEMFSAVNDYSVLEDDVGNQRVSFTDEEGNDAFYDRYGEKYYDNLDLALYDREGVLYYFVYENSELCFFKDEGSGVWDADNVLLAKYCFVDEDGYFVYLDNPEPVKIVEPDKEKEYYFDTPYTDGKGNFYYPALAASWTADGVLVTSREQIK